MPGSAGVTHLNVVQGASPGPYPVGPAPGGGKLAPTSWGDYGLDEQSASGAFDPGSLFHSPRSSTLAFRFAYYKGQQHDNRQFSMDAQMLPAGGRAIPTTQPFIGGQEPNYYVPMSQRRPCAPYRLARKVTGDFTAMLFGQGRWPQMRSDDDRTQAAAEQLVKESKLASVFTQARNFGGATGTAGVSWCFRAGKPIARAHKGQHIHVLAWEDEDSSVPAHVVELKQRTQLGIDPEDGKLKPLLYWLRRDWTQQADVVFKPTLVNSEEGPVWQIDEELSWKHQSGSCHFVWIQNLPSEDDSEDGCSDYGETFDQMDALDELNSVHQRGTIKNLDPTLHLRVSTDQQEKAGGSVGIIRKGSDNAIVTDEKGGAEYLQLADTQVGERAVNQQRQQLLEVMSCIVLDPEKAAAAASSGEAQKLLYAPMLGQCDVLRQQWGPAVERTVNQMLNCWRQLRETPLPANDAGFELPTGDDGMPTEVTEEQELPVVQELEYGDLDLKPRVVFEVDELGAQVKRLVPHEPGEQDVELEWGPYFKPTGQDKQQITGALGAAAAGKPVLSQETAVALAANLWDKDGNKEWELVQREAGNALDREAADLQPPPADLPEPAVTEPAAPPTPDPPAEEEEDLPVPPLPGLGD